LSDPVESQTNPPTYEIPASRGIGYSY
jgi:hypothetical protein